MPWVAGTFSRIFGSTGWTDDKNAAIKILSSRHDTHDQDLADGINACLTRDNLAKPTASFLPATDNTLNLGSGSFRWNSLNGIAVTDFARLTQNNTFSQSVSSGVIQITQNTSSNASAYAVFTAKNNTPSSADYGITSTAYSNIWTGGPTGAQVFLGTSANIPISIATSAVERIRIAGDGSLINLQATSVQVNGKPIAAIGAFKAASTARASTTTFTDDPDLVITGLPAGTYEFTAHLFFNATTAGGGGIKFQITFSGTVSNAAAMTLISFAATNTNTFSAPNVSLLNVAAFDASPLLDSALASGTFTISNTNTVSIQWAQNSSSVNAANLLLMSSFLVRRIA